VPRRSELGSADIQALNDWLNKQLRTGERVISMAVTQSYPNDVLIIVETP
jgi:hypothetical protein